MMKPYITSVKEVFPEFTHIQWNIDDPNGMAGSIDILRSTSPEGPFETLATLAQGSYFYKDYDPGYRDSLQYPLYYRIRVQSLLNPSEYSLSDPRAFNYDNIYSTQPHRQRLVRVARYNLRITLERLNGLPFYLLKKKYFGARCSKCFNEITQDVIISSCTECYGTSNSGGYCSPIKIWLKIDPDNASSTFGIGGESKSNVLGAVMLDYPRVDMGDILVDCARNTRYSVTKINATTSSSVVVHQELQLSELSRHAIEYSIPVDLI
jgi:hypothetical protein